MLKCTKYRFVLLLPMLICLAWTVQGQTTIQGSITDDAGEVLIGVNIQAKGTNKGTATDFEGNFTLKDIDENAVLVVSSVGYQKQEVAVAGKSNLTITLVSDSQLLDQVVVVGYGTQKKRDLTGAIASVQSEDFVKGVATNALQLLSGKASGVNVSQTNLEPCANLNIFFEERAQLIAVIVF